MLKNIEMIVNIDWPGWLLLVLSYVILFFYQNIRRDAKLFAAIFFVLSLHHAVALVNAYIVTTFGASADARAFQHAAVTFVSDGLKKGLSPIDYFYPLFLSFFYRIFAPSLLLGEELSVWAFLFSCFIVIKIYKMLGYSKYLPLLIVLYGSLPSMVFWGSVTVRESWQILLFMLVIYFCMKNLFYDSLGSWFLWLISSSVFIFLHEGFFVFVPLLAIIMLFFHAKKQLFSKPCIYSSTQSFSILLTILFFILFAILFILWRENISKIHQLEAFLALSRGEVLSYVSMFRTRGLVFQARTTYGFNLDMSSFFTLLMTFFKCFLYYMFAPFPWQVSNLMDFYGTCEALMRLTLIILGCIAWFKASANKRRPLFFILLVYFLMSVLWSLGTISYGTSIRHNIVSYWLLILLLGAYLHNRTDLRYVLKNNHADNYNANFHRL